jgi:hypothetical protein
MNSRNIIQTQKSMNVFSIDADGCLFNNDYNMKENNLLAANILLRIHIIELLGDHNRIMVGSSRQTQQTDVSNSRHNHTFLFFKELPRFASALSHISRKEVNMDQYLIADSFCHVPDGSTFNDEEKTDAPFDASKLLILYAQTHRMSSLYENQKVHFHFYDDGDDIIDQLTGFFTKYPDLLPPNLTLHLYYYDGVAKPRCTAVIDGNAAVVDHQYGSSIIKLNAIDHIINSKFNQNVNDGYGNVKSIIGGQYEAEIITEFKQYIVQKTLQNTVIPKPYVRPIVESDHNTALNLPKSQISSQGFFSNSRAVDGNRKESKDIPDHVFC